MIWNTVQWKKENRTGNQTRTRNDFTEIVRKRGFERSPVSTVFVMQHLFDFFLNASAHKIQIVNVNDNNNQHVSMTKLSSLSDSHSSYNYLMNRRGNSSRSYSTGVQRNLDETRFLLRKQKKIQARLTPWEVRTIARNEATVARRNKR